MARDRDFQELLTPAEVAKKLTISVATLRKYSLIVEKATDNKDYFARTKQKARLYTDANVADLKSFKELARDGSLTLQEAAQQVFTSPKAEPKHRAKNQASTAEKPMAQQVAKVDANQFGKLLQALQQTIAQQNSAIAGLQKQVAEVKKQNEQLLKNQKELAAPNPQPDQAQADKIAAMPDISGIVEPKPMPTREEEKKRQAAKIAADKKKSADELHSEILKKARENSSARAMHRTLADMQIPQKQHWWQRFLN